MNKIVRFLLILLVSCIIFTGHVAASGDFWTEKAPLPLGEGGLGAAVVNEKIYVFGGFAANIGILNTTEEYDPATNTWISRAPMPVPGIGWGVTVCQNKIYAINGTVNEVYDPTTNTWENRKPMPTERESLQANAVGNKIYLIGGMLNVPPRGEIFGVTEVYDPSSDSWTTLASMPYPVNRYASAVIDGKIYIFGGSTSSDQTSTLVQIFDPETNNWTTGAPMPAAVFGGAAAATTGVFAPKRIYVIGGSDSDLNQIYDPENNSWTFGAPMPTARLGLAVAVMNDTLYAIGGNSGFELPGIIYDANEQYTPLGYGTLSSPSPSPLPSPSVPEFSTQMLNVLIVTFVASTAVAAIVRKKIVLND